MMEKTVSNLGNRRDEDKTQSLGNQKPKELTAEDVKTIRSGGDYPSRDYGATFKWF